jgi:hypothetical protein
MSVNPEEWVLPTQTDFGPWVTDTFAKYNTTKEAASEASCDSAPSRSGRPTLFPHQEFVRQYLQKKSPYRGLLLYHGLGVGKTCSSIAVAEGLLEDRQVVVMLPAALRTNYVNEIKKCGSESYVKDNMYWAFSKVKKPKNVSAAIRQLHGGVWIAKPDKESNLDKLSPLHIEQIDAQIADTIEHSYSFLHYNGLTKSKLEELTEKGKTNPFDDKVIVVDEVHNMISGVSNSAPIMSTLYDLVLKARNAKLVLLSGTPIINKPFEVGLMLNLVKGPETAYTFEFSKTEAEFVQKVEATLKKVPRVDWFHVEPENKNTVKATVTLVPEGFAPKPSGRVTSEKRDPEGAKGRIEKLHKVLKKLDPKTKPPRESTHMAFPNTEKLFDKYFVNSTEAVMSNTDMFMRRATGAVSYYVNDNPKLYPQTITQEENLFMSDLQFERYSMARLEEYKLEKLQSKQRGGSEGGLFGSTPSVYKAYTRAICNFVFPKKVERPRPKDFADEFGEASSKQSAYSKKLDEIIDKLGSRHLRTDLAKHSPKFARAVEHIGNSPGGVLVYSQFRRVEGIEIMCKCLDAHGYGELRLVREGSEWKADFDPKKLCYAKFKPDDGLTGDQRVEFNTILLNIFNNDFDQLPESVRRSFKGKDNLRGDTLRVMFITQSGAEGISLKNVRQVHVMEPYWNQNRVDQVVGRARRMCSHVGLPSEDRNFTVYNYRMRLSPEQIERSKHDIVISTNDKNVTTDESIAEIANRKTRVLSQFLECMRLAAVDCGLHNTSASKCYVFPVEGLSQKRRSYTLEIDRDISITKKTVKYDSKKVWIITVKKPSVRRYIYLQDTHELFDAQLYESTRVLQLRGHAKPMGASHYTFTFL